MDRDTLPIGALYITAADLPSLASRIDSLADEMHSFPERLSDNTWFELRKIIETINKFDLRLRDMEDRVAELKEDAE